MGYISPTVNQYVKMSDNRVKLLPPELLRSSRLNTIRQLPPSKNQQIELYGGVDAVVVDVVDLSPRQHTQPHHNEPKQFETLNDLFDSYCPTPEELADIITRSKPPTYLEKLGSALRRRGRLFSWF
jgi:hypothetical protein